MLPKGKQETESGAVSQGAQTPAIIRQSPGSPPVFIMCASAPACAWHAQLCASFIAVAVSGRCRGRMLRSPPVEVFPLVDGSPVGIYWWSCSWAIKLWQHLLLRGCR